MFKRKNTNSEAQVIASAISHSETSERNRVLQLSAVVGLSLMALVLPACSPGDLTRDSEPQITTEEVTQDTQQLIGQTVTVRSDVDDQIGPNTFTISDSGLFGADPIVVVNATGTPFVLPTDIDADVQVTGEVQRFVLADIERQYNLGLDPAVYGEYENEPVIIAQSLALAPRAGDITDNPERYYGQTIAVQGEIDEVMVNNSFTLQDGAWIGGQDLLVLKVGQPTTAIQDGQEVVVTGELRPMNVAEIQRDYNVTWDGEMQQRLEAEYQNRPVLIAEATYPLTQQNGGTRTTTP
ncbi:MAG: hypothetical protein LRZ84_22055 [Desertifilum sp.]|nr:hypothetical protein [Desertifilum sp.]